jgi:sialic acid synthase SpsE/sugar phosphate isomerase/epimerase
MWEKIKMKNDFYIIAEIGINHDGSSDKARELIKKGADSGVHAIKFQYRNLKNAYSDTNREIGDEILLNEISKTYLSPGTLIELTEYAHDIGLEVGISFFDGCDIVDFSSNIEKFDFFKVPSVELTNIELIDVMMDLGKHLYISLGAHNEEEVVAALDRLPNDDSWTPLHCISNYPVTTQNSRLGYIRYLINKWGRRVGYSSHDIHWETCLIAMQMGARIIERHITLDCSSEGLDHSSSSTPDHFSVMTEFSKNMPLLSAGNAPRSANQGELLNRQNLGRSYFASRELKSGDKISFNDLSYRSPNIGLNKTNIDQFISKKLKNDVRVGSSITKSSFEKKVNLPDAVVDFSRRKGLSLPVRLHDQKCIEELFPIRAFELHLSFGEILSDIDVSLLNRKNKYSIHLPDYINSTQLMDPFSKGDDQRKDSIKILDRTVDLAEMLQNYTGVNVPIVGSFSVIHNDRDTFFEEHSELLKSYFSRGIEVIPQWLPPIAWYFGGSVSLHTMNEVIDADYLIKHKLGVCLDICHMILGRNFFNFSAIDLMQNLDELVRHVHIADAVGIDGEGLAIGEGEKDNLSLIEKSLEYDCIKVIEVWQGHFDNGAGFRKALTALAELYDHV